jgi:hypothetical protein
VVAQNYEDGQGFVNLKYFNDLVEWYTNASPELKYEFIGLLLKVRVLPNSEPKKLWPRNGQQTSFCFSPKQLYKEAREEVESQLLTILAPITQKKSKKGPNKETIQESERVVDQRAGEKEVQAFSQNTQTTPSKCKSPKYKFLSIEKNI